MALFISLSIFSPSELPATSEYAAQTSKPCMSCHVDPNGGGILTDEGESFKNDLMIKGLYKPLTTAQRIIRFIVGYLHIMTAIMWFGTILYVHVLLKPAYAAKGLPRGELSLGWVSIFIIAITGTLLTLARVPSLTMLIETRFGILLLIKISLFLTMAVTATIATFIIGPKLRKKRNLNFTQHKQDLTLDELSQFDGREGKPAYVALNGNIYDVTNSRLWKDGSHMKKHNSGNDLTKLIKQAPHGEDKVTSMKLVGKLLLEEKIRKPLYERVFYFFAYMNLVLIFLIVFVISLWRWL